MAELWPSTLQDILNEENFSFNKGSTVQRSDMDIGPQKVRRRFTKSVDTLTGSVNLTSAQYTTFFAFYDTTLNGGVLSFNFDHPITGGSAEWRFNSEPKVSSIGGGNFTVNFSWELVP